MQVMLINTTAVAAYLNKALHLTAIPRRSIATGEFFSSEQNRQWQ